MNIVVLALCFGVFESVWRRWFGGGFDWRWLKWINFRFVKHCVNIAAIFALCFYWRSNAWYWALADALVMQLLFWTLTFGMYFDIGHHGRPTTEEDIKAYNKPWFSSFLNWCFPDEYRYTPFYDYCGMMIRFTWPVAIISFFPTFNSGMLMLGTWVAMIYGLGWVMYEKEWLKKIGPTEVAEFASGFITGLYLVLNCMI